MAELVYYGGDGFHSRENGIFKVCTDGADYRFTCMSKAREFYDTLKGEKFFWDITGAAELLDGWCYDEEE